MQFLRLTGENFFSDSLANGSSPADDEEGGLGDDTAELVIPVIEVGGEEFGGSADEGEDGVVHEGFFSSNSEGGLGKSLKTRVYKLLRLKMTLQAVKAINKKYTPALR